jgi:HD-GYP domain-containing protein (c-di-GMP phosphodiesterase class II)
MINTKIIELPGRDYIPIDVDQLLTGDVLPFDIYIKDINLIKYLLSRGIVFTDIARNHLKEIGVSEVYIPEKYKDILDSYLSGIGSERARQPDSTKFEDYLYRESFYHQIDGGLLMPGIEVNFSLFEIDGSRIRILLEASDASPSKIGDNLAEADGNVLIKRTDICRYNAYLDSLAGGRLPEETGVGAIIIRENSKIVMRDLFDNPGSDKKMKESIALVNNIIECITKHRHAMFDMVSLRNHDYYTYTHSVNVAVLSIGLGISMDMKRGDIENLGIGAMLHDIGKSVISPHILNKPGKLTNEEFRIIRTHVHEGTNILKRHKGIHEDAIIPVLQHHEKLSGRGYPLQLSGEEVKPTGRMSAIVDCYDALTTRRPYNPVLTPFDALSIIKNETGSYDHDILRAFIMMLGDTGSKARLKTV